MTKTGSVHILGAGAMGGLVAYGLATLKSPPLVTVLWRNKDRHDGFVNTNGSQITFDRLYKPEEPRVKQYVQSACPETITGPIENLIITTKTYQTQSALAPYLPLITPQTNILLIQNGLGVSDELYRDVWPQVDQRPNLFQGVINHGGFIIPHETDYVVAHAGDGDLNLCKLPKGTAVEPFEQTPPQFIQQLIDAEILKTHYMSYPDLTLVQLKKFTVNACMNTITAIIDCLNGELNNADRVKELFTDIVAEAIHVFKECLPALQGNEKADKVLNVEALVENCIHVGIIVNAKNSSSMRQDTLNLRDTEIDYINGYVVSLAEKNGLSADVNKTICNLVKLRLSINRARA